MADWDSRNDRHFCISTFFSAAVASALARARAAVEDVAELRELREIREWWTEFISSKSSFSARLLRLLLYECTRYDYLRVSAMFRILFGVWGR